MFHSGYHDEDTRCGVQVPLKSTYSCPNTHMLFVSLQEFRGMHAEGKSAFSLNNSTGTTSQLSFPVAFLPQSVQSYNDRVQRISSSPY